MIRRSHAWVILAAVATVSWGCHALRPSTPPPLAVERVEVMPNFTTNALVYGRDAGNSIRMGDDILWVFGDTFTWTGMPCATAAWSSATTPNELYEPVDSDFSSYQFYQLTPEEAAYNDSRDPPLCCSVQRACDSTDRYCWCPSSTDCTTRIALWPGDLIPTDDQHALHLYEKVRIGSAPYDFQHLGTGLAIVRHGETRAHRVLGPEGAPLMLFGPDEPNFLRAVEVEDGSRVRIYLFAVTNREECNVDILLSRVDLATALDRDTYEYWNGDGWSDSLDQAVPILHQVVGGLGSVTWNDHLQQFLSAFNDICTGGDSLVLRTSPRPEGPWSQPTFVDLAPFGAAEGAYAGQIHTSLESGQDVIFTFYQPLALGVGRLRMGRLHLR